MPIRYKQSCRLPVGTCVRSNGFKYGIRFYRGRAEGLDHIRLEFQVNEGRKYLTTSYTG